MMKYLKKISDAVPAFMFISAITAGLMGFYAGQAVADHNDDKEAHTIMLAYFSGKITDNTNKTELLDQRFKLTQEQNKTAHSDQEKKLDRIILVLDKIADKVNASN